MLLTIDFVLYKLYFSCKHGMIYSSFKSLRYGKDLIIDVLEC